MSRPSGLGRGLSALLPSALPGQSGLRMLRLDAIVGNRRQPRKDFDENALVELARSIAQVGLLQPILVRPLDDGRYEIVAGERRYRAAGIAGLEELPAIVRHTADEDLLTEALVENLHRSDLNPIEEAAACQQLLDDFGLTHEGLAEKLGRSRPAISNSLRLLGLAPAVQRHVAAGSLSAGHARALLAIERPEQQERTAQRVLAEDLSVRETEALVRRVGVDPERSTAALQELADQARRRASGPFAHLQPRLSDALATRVRVRGNRSRGSIVIDFSGTEDLERLLGLLGRATGDDLLSES